ncbi:hypothetical protein EDC04DRAFT_2615045 [Pisolithus marmoratus]|nr:hypothetical protein EDC04DRAFT_2615045 [Pisolithus marmoratus]
MSAEYNTHHPILHSLQELVGPATTILSLLKLVMLPNNFQCLCIRFPPYYPEENALSSILSCAEYLPQLPSLEISMPMITSTDELAAFAAFPINDKCILPVWHLTFRGMHPVCSTPDVLGIIVDPSLLRCTGIFSIPSPNRILKFQLFCTSMYWDILYLFTQQNIKISTIPYLWIQAPMAILKALHCKKQDQEGWIKWKAEY